MRPRKVCLRGFTKLRQNDTPDEEELHGDGQLIGFLDDDKTDPNVAIFILPSPMQLRYLQVQVLDVYGSDEAVDKDGMLALCTRSLEVR